MGFYRLIKPDWAKPLLANDEANPNFVEEIQGPDVIEGYNYSEDELKQMNGVGYNVYFFPNHPSKDVYSEGIKHLSGKHIDVFDFVFVDMDLKDKVYATKEDFLKKVNEFPLKPTMVVNSGNGVHVYWQIEGLTKESYVITQLALINYFKTDPSVFTVLQLMRLPGYMNTKRHKDYVPAAVIESHSSGEIYTLDRFPQDIYNLPDDVVTRGQNHLAKLDGRLKIDLPFDVNLDELPDKFIEFISNPKNEVPKKLFMDPKGFSGDRSRADMTLTNILFKAGFDKKEALAVIANTQKAISRGPNRNYYANLTVDKVYDEQKNEKYLTVGQKLRTQDNQKNLGQLVRGPWYLDYEVLGNPWRKKEVLGLIAGTGVGKTAKALKIIKDTIENNPDNDDIHVFIELEMPEADIIDRWIKLVGSTSKLADRLYVIGNEDEKGEPRNIGLQEIVEICQDLKKMTGKNIGTLVVDHIGIVSRHIDTNKKYTFGIQSEPNSGYGNVRTLSLNSLATQMKPLAKLLNLFLMVLTQTTKEKGIGDLPVDKDGAYGISQYENIMDRIITIWQPLMRVQNQSKYRFLAWQYVKIRNKHNNDKLQTHEPKLLTYIMETGDLKMTTQEEYSEFQRLLPMAADARDKIQKKKADGYSINLNTTKLDSVQLALAERNKQKEQANGVSKVQPH